LPVETFDERFTSSISCELSGITHKTARSQSKGQARKKKEKRLSGDIDKISAAILLNDYLAKNIFQK
jgi:RNase H-fold protein (predicted Holliday junction resolvase)